METSRLCRPLPPIPGGQPASKVQSVGGGDRPSGSEAPSRGKTVARARRISGFVSRLFTRSSSTSPEPIYVDPRKLSKKEQRELKQERAKEIEIAKRQKVHEEFKAKVRAAKRKEYKRDLESGRLPPVATRPFSAPTADEPIYVSLVDTGVDLVALEAVARLVEAKRRERRASDSTYTDGSRNTPSITLSSPVDDFAPFTPISRDNPLFEVDEETGEVVEEDLKEEDDEFGFILAEEDLKNLDAGYEIIRPEPQLATHRMDDLTHVV